MHTSLGPTLADTIAFIKKGDLAVDRQLAKKHLENLLYMKSILYLDDKKNEKHISRVNSVLALFKKEYSKEWAEAGQAEGNLYLVAHILAANKILEAGIAHLQDRITRVKEIQEPAPQAVQSAAAEVPEKNRQGWSATLAVAEEKEKPKLRETLGFLVSIIGDPLRTNNKIPLHLSNLEKMSKLIRRKYQDPKLQKLSESILASLSKIYGRDDEKELYQLLVNSIKILSNLKQYQLLLTDFENQLKDLIAKGEQNTEPLYFSKQTQLERFYKDFREEKNVMKKISMAELVLSGSAYKYNKELNNISLSFLSGLEKMGLHVEK